MPINTLMKNIRYFILISLLSISTFGFAQVIWENKNNPVYTYLSRMADKGFISLNDMIQPIPRNIIESKLQELLIKKEQLNKIELADLLFYLEEFSDSKIDTNAIQIGLLVKDKSQRWRTLNLSSNNFTLKMDPIISANYLIGDINNITQVSNGLSLWGTVGKKWSYQVYYQDYTERGTVRKYYTVNGNNFQRNESSPGFFLVGLNNETMINHSDLRASITYSFKNGSLSFLKDNFLWGYGENGRIIHSDRAPTYPHIRFDYSPIKGLHFNMIHGWLNSNLVDSNQSYHINSGGVSGDIRIIYIPKFIASHSLLINLKKGLDIAIGESVIYSDQLDPGFMIPINLYKIYDDLRSNYRINAGANGQYFLQLSSRNQIKNTHLYGSLFIDEIRLAEIFNAKKSRNQIGFTLGGTVTDYFLPNLKLGIEYTRVNPFVYNNLIPAQQYTNYDYFLGDWMGSNFQRKILFARYNYLPRLNFYARIQLINKGGPGSLYDQYNAEPQPSFLSDYQLSRNDIYLQASYEWFHNFYVKAGTTYIYEKITTGAGKKKYETLFNIGCSFGLP